MTLYTTSKILIHKHFFLIYCYHNQKGTSNKFCHRNILISMILILYHKQKEQAINFVSEIFRLKKLLKTKGTHNKSTLEKKIFFHFL